MAAEAEECCHGACVGSKSSCAAPLLSSWRRPPCPEAPNEEVTAERVQAVSTGKGTQAGCGLRGGGPHRHPTMVREGPSWSSLPSEGQPPTTSRGRPPGDSPQVRVG